MKRHAPWIIAAVALIAFVASFSELQRVRKRLADASRHTVHDHQDVRQFMIRSQLSGIEGQIVIIGDSIAEMTPFPQIIAGKPVINAGVGGATIHDYYVLAPKIFEGSRPSLIVVAIGANDQGSTTIEKDFANLLSVLRPLAPLLVIDLPDGPTSDGIHPTPAAARSWAQSTTQRIELALNSKD